MIDFIKLVTIWILLLISLTVVATFNGKACKYIDETKAKILQVCLDKGISYQECYAGLNYYNYWDSRTSK